MRFVKCNAKIFVCIAFAGIGISTAHAGTLVVYKLGVDATGANAITPDVVTGWQTPGSFGTDASLTDATSDYRNSWVDNATNWASVTSIDVGMYDANGDEVAYFDFAGPDTVQGAGVTISDFFTPSDLVSTNYTDIPSPFTGNYFSEAGDTQRHFFVQNNYGGCPSDMGWFVLDTNGGEGCGWESYQQGLNTSGSDRAFLYALDNTLQNWNNNGNGAPDDVGSADVFAITVTSSLVSSTPEPSTLLMLGSGLGALGFIRIRRRG
jgi:hypothetical protein